MLTRVFTQPGPFADIARDEVRLCLRRHIAPFCGPNLTFGLDQNLGVGSVAAPAQQLVDPVLKHVRGAEHQHAARGRIGTSSPVFGLRPMRCALSRTENVPNDETLTNSPRANVLEISSSTD